MTERDAAMASPGRNHVDATPTWIDELIVFKCQGMRLVGVLTRPVSEVRGPGVLIVVGGPQYRAGSHRHFVQVARRVAAAGFPVLRFDARGTGDSEGEPLGFERQDADLKAASDFLCEAAGVERVVLWGLCDGASAALMYVGRSGDSRVAGLCLLNPWVRTPALQASAQVKHYYADKWRDPKFWRRLLTGHVAPRALLDYGRAATSMLLGRGRDAAASEPGFVEVMAAGWRLLNGQILLVLSGRDQTAREFEEACASHPNWRGALARANLTRCDIAEADHTLSDMRLALKVDGCLTNWLAHLPSSERLPSKPA